MTAASTKPVTNRGHRATFLERTNYRQRRFRDAARWLPIFASILMLLPLFWPRDMPDQSLTSSGMIYLFGLWVILVGVAFVLSRVLQHSDALDIDESPSGQGRE